MREFQFLCCALVWLCLRDTYRSGVAGQFSADVTGGSNLKAEGLVTIGIGYATFDSNGFSFSASNAATNTVPFVVPAAPYTITLEMTINTLPGTTQSVLLSVGSTTIAFSLVNLNLNPDGTIGVSIWAGYGNGSPGGTTPWSIATNTLTTLMITIGTIAQGITITNGVVSSNFPYAGTSPPQYTNGTILFGDPGNSHITGIISQVQLASGSGGTTSTPTSGGTTSTPTSGSGSGVGDPHFTGFDGQEFDFQGDTGHIYSVYSSSNLDIMARFCESWRPFMNAQYYPDIPQPRWMDAVTVIFYDNIDDDNNNKTRDHIQSTIYVDTIQITQRENTFPPSPPPPVYVNELTVPIPTGDPYHIHQHHTLEPLHGSHNNTLHITVHPNGWIRIMSNPIHEQVYEYEILISRKSDDFLQNYLDIAMNVTSHKPSTGILGQTRIKGVIGEDITVSATSDASDTIELHHHKNTMNKWQDTCDQNPDMYRAPDTTLFGPWNSQVYSIQV